MGQVVSGILINMAFPAQCAGIVRGWNYCYYPNLVQDGVTYSAVFGVGRYTNTSSQTIIILEDTDVTVTLQSEYTVAALHCKTVELEPKDYFSIEVGDFVGVYLPANNSIPLVGTSNEYTSLINLLNIQNPQMSELSLSAFNEVPYALHLYADIGKINK